MIAAMKQLNQTVQKVLSILLIGLGVGLQGYMVTVEHEPGAVPFGLIALGVVWYVLIRYRTGPHSG